MTYAKSVLIAIDQLGNALAGGNPDCTISGRIGYYSTHSKGLIKLYWLALEAVVDFTFYPFDGYDHCYQAYVKEQKNEFYTLNSFKVLALLVLSIITLGSCAILAPIFWLIYGIKTLIKEF